MPKSTENAGTKDLGLFSWPLGCRRRRCWQCARGRASPKLSLGICYPQTGEGKTTSSGEGKESRRTLGLSQ